MNIDWEKTFSLIAALAGFVAVIYLNIKAPKDNELYHGMSDEEIETEKWQDRQI